MFKSALVKSRLNVGAAFSLYDYKKQYRRKHPDEFPVSGILLFCGAQGSGKSLTASNYIKDLVSRYPKVKVISNARLCGIDYIPYRGIDTVVACDNGDCGIILYLDEISNQFNSLNSKDIDPAWFTITNMQRKRHLHVVGTCPVFNRIGKAWREQFDTVCFTSQILGYIQINRYFRNNVDSIVEDDVMAGLQPIKTQIFFVDPAMFATYDTYEVVTVINDTPQDRSRRR